MTRIEVDGHVFLCGSELEQWRAKTLLTKESGTVKWLRREVRPGDVFYDVGANIGLYTIVAAKLGATVYAFEPHAANAASLARNLEANHLTEKVWLLSCALDAESGFQPFNAVSTKPGTSGHQLGHALGENGKPFEPAIRELKYATTVDDLAGVVVPPTLVKIDVDGNEARVLAGMHQLLSGSNRPRQIQVEIHPHTAKTIFAFLEAHGYPPGAAGRHDTLHGKALQSKGMPADKIAYNAVFRYAPAA